MSQIKKICFVCTGNTCRSPMGEHLMRREVERAELDYIVCSAGAAAVDGNPASEYSAAVCAEAGLDLSGHAARLLDGSYAREDTAFAVMSERHGAWLRRSLGVPEDMIYLVGKGIPDPYMGSMGAYRECFESISAAVPGLLRAIAQDEEKRACIRDANESDIQFICELEHSALGTAPSEQSIAQELAFEHSVLLTAEHYGKRLGFISAQFTADTVFIINLCVLSAHRGKGIGSHLLYAMRQIAFDAGCGSISLEVRSSNAGARGLYAATGFEEIGIRPGFYSAPKEDAVIMTAQLR